MIRKGRITRIGLRRRWPHHVALPADKVLGVMNNQIVWSFAETLSAVPRPYSLRRDDGEFVVFCLTKPEDAEAFAARREYGRGTADRVSAKLQTIWLFITPST